VCSGEAKLGIQLAKVNLDGSLGMLRANSRDTFKARHKKFPSVQISIVPRPNAIDKPPIVFSDGTN
jgi:hypothetical protein